MSKKCRAYSKSKLGLAPSDNRKAFYAGWDAAMSDRLAQQEQEPVAWRWKERINNDFDSWVVTSSEPPFYATEEQPLYTAPPQRKPLTAPQIHELDWPNDVAFEEILEFVRAIERAHDIGGKE